MSIEKIRQQARDEKIRIAVAYNPKVTIKIIKQIDDNKKILKNAHCNPDLPENLLEYLL